MRPVGIQESWLAVKIKIQQQHVEPRFSGVPKSQPSLCCSISPIFSIRLELPKVFLQIDLTNRAAKHLDIIEILGRICNKLGLQLCLFHIVGHHKIVLRTRIIPALSVDHEHFE
jgi:hypothetical protein